VVMRRRRRVFVTLLAGGRSVSVQLLLVFCSILFRSGSSGRRSTTRNDYTEEWKAGGKESKAARFRPVRLAAFLAPLVSPLSPAGLSHSIRIASTPPLRALATSTGASSVLPKLPDSHQREGVNNAEGGWDTTEGVEEGASDAWEAAADAWEKERVGNREQQQFEEEVYGARGL
jgi:hypothetical protein